MSTIILYFLIASACMLTSGLENSINAGKTPIYDVNLDLPASERWKHVLKDVNSTAFGAEIHVLLQSLLPEEIIPLVEIIAADLIKYIPQPYADEIRSISQLLGLPLGDAVISNIVYDLTAYKQSSTHKGACTSIVALDKSGKILQGRNLDYDFAQFLRKITMEVRFFKNKKLLFEATTYAGYVGVITGSKPGAFSVSGDERDTGSLWQNLLAAARGASITFFAERQMLERATDYQSALRMARTTPTAAPVYFILGGVGGGEGAIVTRDAGGIVNVTSIGDNSDHPWFVVETNYDPWKKPPANDDRRDVAIASMRRIGQNKMDADALFQVLSTPPVFNCDTTYTTIMQAATGFFRSFVRYDYPPCAATASYNDLISPQPLIN